MFNRSLLWLLTTFGLIHALQLTSTPLDLLVDQSKSSLEYSLETFMYSIFHPGRQQVIEFIPLYSLLTSPLTDFGRYLFVSIEPHNEELLLAYLRLLAEIGPPQDKLPSLLPLANILKQSRGRDIILAQLRSIVSGIECEGHSGTHCPQHDPSPFSEELAVSIPPLFKPSLGPVLESMDEFPSDHDVADGSSSSKQPLEPFSREDQARVLQRRFSPVQLLLLRSPLSLATLDPSDFTPEQLTLIVTFVHDYQTHLMQSSAFFLELLSKELLTLPEEQPLWRLIDLTSLGNRIGVSDGKHRNLPLLRNIYHILSLNTMASSGLSGDSEWAYYRLMAMRHFVPSGGAMTLMIRGLWPHQPLNRLRASIEVFLEGGSTSNTPIARQAFIDIVHLMPLPAPAKILFEFEHLTMGLLVGLPCQFMLTQVLGVLKKYPPRQVSPLASRNLFRLLSKAQFYSQLYPQLPFSWRRHFDNCWEGTRHFPVHLLPGWVQLKGWRQTYLHTDRPVGNASWMVLAGVTSLQTNAKDREGRLLLKSLLEVSQSSPSFLSRALDGTLRFACYSCWLKDIKVFWVASLYRLLIFEEPLPRLHPVLLTFIRKGSFPRSKPIYRNLCAAKKLNKSHKAMGLKIARAFRKIFWDLDIPTVFLTIPH